MVANELGVDVAPELALAGVIASGEVPGSDDTEWLLDRAKQRDLTRRPGVAVPVSDLVDGVAHSLLYHADWSGSRDAVATVLEEFAVDSDPRRGEEFDEDDHRAVASAVAIDATETTTPERAATTIGRALRPYVTRRGPFETLGGYADVLDAVARQQPGIAVAQAVGGDVREPALAAWRTHARQVHEAIETSSTGRYDGYVVARVGDAPVVSTAQLYRDTVAPEPLVVAVGTNTVGLAARHDTDARRPTEALTDALDGTTTATRRYGFVSTNSTGIDERTVIETLREVL
jgi:hypothetical protein